MSRNESEREDLLREATALTRRVELTVPGEPRPVVAGVRAGDVISIYFGDDPAYHFDGDNRLRRAFAGGRLFRSQGNTLAELTRVRAADSTTLERRDLAPSALDRFLSEMRARLAHLRDALADRSAQVTRQVPDEDDFLPELTSRLSALLDEPAALAPPLNAAR